MTLTRLRSTPEADLEIESAFEWYENQRPGLGLEFLEELRSTYERVVAGPLHYQELRSGVRRALVRRFPYAVFFATDNEEGLILAVLHAGRSPQSWPG